MVGAFAPAAVVVVVVGLEVALGLAPTPAVGRDDGS